MAKGIFNAGELDGFLGRSTSMTGDLRFDTSMRIDGTFKGSIRSESELSIGESGDIEADIEVATLHVYGKVTGKIRATESVEIHPGGKVVGDIRAPNLVTKQGAVFRGNCFIGEEEDENAGSLHTERAFFRGA